MKFHTKCNENRSFVVCVPYKEFHVNIEDFCVSQRKTKYVNDIETSIHNAGYP